MWARSSHRPCLPLPYANARYASSSSSYPCWLFASPLRQIALLSPKIAVSALSLPPSPSYSLHLSLSSGCSSHVRSARQRSDRKECAPSHRPNQSGLCEFKGGDRTRRAGLGEAPSVCLSIQIWSGGSISQWYLGYKKPY